MSMIEMGLSALEREVIRKWIEEMGEISSGWGGDELVFPDEAMVEDTIRKEGVLRLSRHHLELILDWAESAHQNLAFTVDEIMLLRKVQDAVSRNDTGEESS